MTKRESLEIFGVWFELSNETIVFAQKYIARRRREQAENRRARLKRANTPHLVHKARTHDELIAIAKDYQASNLSDEDFAKSYGVSGQALWAWKKKDFWKEIAPRKSHARIYFLQDEKNLIAERYCNFIGSDTSFCKATGISRNSLMAWKKEDWWKEIVNNALAHSSGDSSS